MDDSISRKTALYSYQEEVCNKVKCSECKATDEDGTCKLERWIKELPSAERRGSWVGIDDEPCDVWECDQCGHIVERECPPRFCEECGARMDEADE